MTSFNLMHDDRLSWRPITQLWRFELRDEADTVIYTDYLHQMRDTLDMLENTGRLKASSEPPAV